MSRFNLRHVYVIAVILALTLPAVQCAGGGSSSSSNRATVNVHAVVLK
jgi:hypothetical protein